LEIARHLLAAAALACGAGAAFGILYAVLAAALTVRFFARAPCEPESFPPVTLVRPLRGAEQALLRNLSSFCRQDYPGPVQHLFGVSDPGDPALAAVEELRRLHPDAHITAVADPREHGPNRKVSNLINMLPQARHDVLVFADSDVGVAPDYLRRVVGELQRPGIGLVTCLYRGEPDPGFWPRLSAMATNCQFLPGAVAGVALGMAHPCFGQTIAMRRATLEGIGGLAPFTNHLAEDHAIGEAVRAAGGTVAIPPFAISHACVENSLGRLVSHELRWSRTIRAVDPRGHLGSALAHPFALSLLAVLLSGGAAWSWLLAAAALVARLALKLTVDRALRLPIRDLWLLPAWDLLALPIFVATYFSGRVKWRGFEYKVDARGRLTQLR
jgi:ceramide glucosyltransferase